MISGRNKNVARRIAIVDGVVPRKPVEVDAASVADGGARDEPPRPRVVVAVGQQGQAAVVVVVAVLAAKGDGVLLGVPP